MSSSASPSESLLPKPYRAAGLLLVFALLFAWLNLATPLRFLSTTDGDFRHYYDAARQLLSGGSPFSVHGFDYPPLLAYLVAPFASASIETARLSWFVLSLLCLLVAAWGVWRWLGGDLPALVAVGCVWGLAGTARENLVLGQVNPLLLLLLVGVLMWVPRRPAFAAVLLGIAAALKLWPAYLFLGFFAKRQWRALGLGVATAGILVAGPLLLGWLLLPAPHLPVSSGYWMGSPAPLNFSLPAVAARISDPPVARAAMPDSWLAGNVARGFRLSPRAAFASVSVSLVVLLLGAVATQLKLGAWPFKRGVRNHGVWANRELNPGPEASVWAAMIAVCTLAAPISWYHYQLFQFPALALLLAASLRQRAWGKAGVMLLLGAGLTWSQVFAFGRYVETFGWTAGSPILLWSSTSLVAILNLFLAVYLFSAACQPKPEEESRVAS